jgi:DnaK suppressor protein
MPKKKKPARKKTAKKSAARKKKAVRKTTATKKKAAKKKAVRKTTATKKKAAKKKAVRKTTATKKKAAKKKAVRKTTATKKKAASRKKAVKKRVTARKKKTRKKPLSTGKKSKTAKKTKMSKVTSIKKKVKAKSKQSAVKKSRKEKFKPYNFKRGEEYMGPDQAQHFRQLLLNWKRELMEEVDRTVHHMRDEASNFPDPNDRATQEEEFALELRTRDRERKLIKKIDESLMDIDSGNYGYCEICGVEIGVRRLEARPTATLCIDCKTLDEIKERHLG